MPSAAGSGTESEAGAEVGVGDMLAVSKPLEPVGDLLAENAAGEGSGDKTEVPSGTWAEFGTGTVEKAVGGAWPGTVAEVEPAAAVDEDGVGVVGKLLRFY